MVQELVVAAGRECGAFDADDPAQLALIVGGQFEHDRAAHRAPGDDRTIQVERVPESADERNVALRRQPVLFQPPAIGRIRAAVIREVEGDHSEVRRDRLVQQEMPELPAVGAGGVKTEQRYALPCLFEVDAIAFALDVEVQVPTDDRFDVHRLHVSTARRGAEALRNWLFIVA